MGGFRRTRDHGGGRTGMAGYFAAAANNLMANLESRQVPRAVQPDDLHGAHGAQNGLTGLASPADPSRNSPQGAKYVCHLTPAPLAATRSTVPRQQLPMPQQPARA